jgi:hypothetical protein
MPDDSVCEFAFLPRKFIPSYIPLKFNHALEYILLIIYQLCNKVTLKSPCNFLIINVGHKSNYQILEVCEDFFSSVRAYLLVFITRTAILMICLIRCVKLEANYIGPSQDTPKLMETEC